MFLVSDSLERRQNKLRDYLKNGEYGITAILAAADFEWTVRRAIIALGTSPNTVIRDTVLKDCYSLDRYKQAWNKEVKSNCGKSLPEIIPNWEFFKTKAYKLRHRFVHGVIGSSGGEYASIRINAIIDASNAVAKYAEMHGVDLYKRLPIRKMNSKQP
jgi:hypothetical protein